MLKINFVVGMLLGSLVVGVPDAVDTGKENRKGLENKIMSHLRLD